MKTDQKNTPALPQDLVMRGQESVEEVFHSLTSSAKGLTNDEAIERIHAQGRNVLQAHPLRWWRLLARQFASSFVYLLVFAAGISFFLGETTDTIFIVFIILANAALGFLQEYRTDKSVQSLRRYITRHTHVRRNGVIAYVVAEDVAVGDVVVLAAGDTIPADCRFTVAEGLLVDESILTGESEPVVKRTERLPQPPKSFFALENIGFSGTTVVGGSAEGVILHTGNNTVVGRIAALAFTTRKETAFERGMASFSRFTIRLIVITLVAIVAYHVLLRPETLSIGELLVFAAALAVGVIPEALPLVTTVSLAQGALRLARRKVVPRRLTAIEDLGSMDVLCSDKTGTLTENALTVVDTFGASPERTLTAAAIAASFHGERIKQPNNAFDIALWKKLDSAAQKNILGIERVLEIPFDPVRRKNTVVVREDGSVMLITRGAPEEVCRSIRGSDKALAWAKTAGMEGKRVIAIAQKKLRSAPTHAEHVDESATTLVGLLAFRDPLKPSVQQTIEEATQLGVQLKILTGDSVEVSTAVGRAVGLLGSDDTAISGEILDRMSTLEKHRLVEDQHIFARMSPVQKLEVLTLLQEHHTVGFLGEGFNDAPALKIANVALSVQGASDIAQDSSDIILLNPSLHVIVDGIREGRRTYANTMKYLKSTLTSNMGNFYAIAIASLFIPFLPMLPIQILFLNLLTDFPLISIAMDSVEAEEIRAPEGTRMRDILLIAVFLGIISTVFDFIFFGYFLQFGEATLQTYWFVGSVLTELVLLFSIRTRRQFWKAARPSGVLILLTSLAAVITFLAIGMKGVREFFHFAPPTAQFLIISVLLVCIYFVTTELVKLAYYRWMLKAPNARVHKAHSS